MSLNDRLEGPVRELHHALGWTGIVYNDTAGGETEGGRLEWVEDTVGTETTIRIEWPNQQSEQTTQGAGQSVVGDVVIHVDTEEESVYDGSDGENRASVIEDARNGNRYRVLRIRDSDYGIVSCDCEVMA